MTRFFRVGCLFFCICGTLLPGDVRAQTSETSASPKVGKSTPTAEEWYDSSVSLLKQGRRLNRAATQLRKAIGIHDQVQYHVALGCALAGRAASLAEATHRLRYFAADQAKYRMWMTAWEAAQKEPGSPDYGKPRPEPPVLVTKDDDLPFLLTPKDAADQFKTLSEEAGAEWDTALSWLKSAQERAELDYVRGWGMELLRVSGESVGWKELPDAAATALLLTEATKLAPRNAIYRQSLGDMRMDLSASLIRARDKPGALAAYRQALTLKKTNANLWYRVYDLCKQDDPAQAKEAIRQAARYDSDNAYPAYRLAGLLFFDTPYSDYAKEVTRVARETEVSSAERQLAIGKQILAAPDYADMRQAAESALAGVEQGNRARHYEPPVYAPPFPALLKAAWYFQAGNYFDNTTDIRDWHTISVSAGGYLQLMVQQGDKEAGIHAAHILIDMGLKMAGDLYEKPLPLTGTELQRLNNGFSTVLSAYGRLIEALKAAGDTAGAAQFEPEYQQFVEKLAQYRQADRKAHQNSYDGF